MTSEVHAGTPDVLQLIEPLSPLAMLEFLRAAFNLSERDGGSLDAGDERQWAALFDRIARNRPALAEVDPITLRQVYDRLLSSYPELRGRITADPTREMFLRLFFELLSRSNASSKIGFLNLGYDGGEALELEPEDQPNRYAIQLYHQLFGGAFSPAKVAGKELVEVGCGRGGGCDYVARYLHPRSIIGIDLTRASIDHCRRTYERPGLSFRVGKAAALPLDDACCDVLINLESSHCYPSMAAFLAEVSRVLRPGGYFLLSDMRHRDTLTRGWEPLASLDEQLAASGLELLSRRDITAEVSRALELDGETMMDRWDHAASEAADLGEDAAAIDYCRTHWRHAVTVTWGPRLATRSYLYFSYVLRKVHEPV